jgi:hypothetical protein
LTQIALQNLLFELLFFGYPQKRIKRKNGFENELAVSTEGDALVFEETVAEIDLAGHRGLLLHDMLYEDLQESVVDEVAFQH